MTLREQLLAPDASSPELAKRESLDSEKGYLAAQSSEAAEGHSSLLGVTVSLATTSIGGGLLALPFAFSSLGLGLGFALLAASALGSVFSAHLLCRCSAWTGHFSYEEIAAEAYGPRGAGVMQVVMVLLLLGVMASLLVISGDSLQFMAVEVADSIPIFALLLDGVGTSSKALLLGIDAVCLVLPLSLAKSVNALVYSSAGALLCTCLVATALLLRGAAAGDAARVEDLPRSGLTAADALRALPIIMLSFACQVQVPGIYAGLQRRSLRRMGGALVAAGVVDVALYVAVAVFGLLALGDRVLDGAVPGNVLAGFSPGDRVALCMHTAMAIATTCVFPILCIPCRSCVLHLGKLAGRCTGGGSAIAESAVTLVAIGASLGGALLVPDLGKVMGLTGASAGALICYLLPPTFFLRLRRREAQAEQDATTWEARLAWVWLAGLVPVVLASQIATCIGTVSK